MVRCSICQLRFSNLKTLKLHYSKHSKSSIINYFLKFSILLTMPNIFRRRRSAKKPKQVNKKGKVTKKQPKTKTLYLNENFHILCSQNEVIIGDDQNHFNSLFTFNTKSYQQKVKKGISSATNKLKKNLPKQNKCKNAYSSRYSASSEASSNNSKLKRKIKRKKQPFRRQYHINISKIQNTQSLNEKTGEFYSCNCRIKNKPKSMKKADLQIITSDTESCSDTSKTFSQSPETKLFCPKCGNGYRTKAELTEHMYIHETFCRLCNTAFSSKYKFREHMRLHIFKVYMCHICNAEFPIKEMFYKHFESHVEDKTLETVLDMEKEYPVFRYNFLNTDYNTSINNILCYLNDYSELNCYSPRFFKIHCDICRNEVLICDYARHLQSIHSNLFF